MNRHGVLIEYARRMHNRERLVISIEKLLKIEGGNIIDRKTYRKLIQGNDILNQIEIVNVLCERLNLVFCEDTNIYDDLRFHTLYEYSKEGKKEEFVDLVTIIMMELDHKKHGEAQLIDVLHLLKKYKFQFQIYTEYEIKQLLWMKPLFHWKMQKVIDCCLVQKRCTHVVHPVNASAYARA